MAKNENAVEAKKVGDLLVENKVWEDKETHERREYKVYYVIFPNGAKVRFTPLKDDRTLLNFIVEE